MGIKKEIDIHRQEGMRGRMEENGRDTSQKWARKKKKRREIEMLLVSTSHSLEWRLWWLERKQLKSSTGKS